jgi:hypothetical protein
MKQAIDGKIYDTDKATLLAERVPQTIHRRSETIVTGALVRLYVTANKAYFMCEKPQKREGKIRELTREAAIKVYNDLPTKHVDLKEAFPDAGLEEA